MARFSTVCTPFLPFERLDDRGNEKPNTQHTHEWNAVCVCVCVLTEWRSSSIISQTVARKVLPIIYDTNGDAKPMLTSSISSVERFSIYPDLICMYYTQWARTKSITCTRSNSPYNEKMRLENLIFTDANASIVRHRFQCGFQLVHMCRHVMSVLRFSFFFV